MTKIFNRKMSENSISSHLLELRSRLLKVIYLFIIFSIAGMPFATQIYSFVSTPLIELMPVGSSMIATEVASPFMAPIKLVIYIALVLSMPWLFYQIWMYIKGSHPDDFMNDGNQKALLENLKE